MDPKVYDTFASSYDTENASSLLNEHYNRPAILDLAGDVDGLRVLDAGCGSGPMSASLLTRGAVVTAFDGSPAMVEIARARLGESVDLHVADLGTPLPFDDGSFDVAIASLVLHYLEDWAGPLTELRRVLSPSGRLVVSVPHPFVRVFSHPDEDYFATHPYAEEYVFAGEPVTLTHWHRPLHVMTESFTAAGFRIARIDEPAPSADTPSDLLTPRMRRGETTSFLAFLFFALEVA